MSLFIPRFISIIQESGKNQNTIAKDLGISKQKLSKWKTGYNEPNLDDIILLASYFNVTADYLLGLETEFGEKIKVHIGANNSGNIQISGRGNLTNKNFNYPTEK